MGKKGRRKVEGGKSIEVSIEKCEEVEWEVKKKGIVYMVLTKSGDEKREAGPKVEVLRSALKKYRFIRNVSFKDLEDEYELDNDSVSTEKVNLVLADPPYNIRSARGQSNSAYNAFLKTDIEDAVKLIGNVMAPGARGHMFCSDSMF